MFIEQPSNNSEKKEEDRILRFYPKEIDKENLKGELELIIDIVESYTKFATDFSKDNRSKIFDIILYSFYSAFIWKAREQYVAATGTETERRYIYPFLIIGGDYESGKSRILDICGRLIGNNEPFYSGYDKIFKAIRPLMETENICPLLVYEIPQSFFTSKQKNLGESLIKSVANDLSGQHPCFIGTTNVRDFHISGQILTRILYYEIDTNFDKSKSDESKQYLHNIRDKISDELYRDFCYRVINMIKENNDIFSRPDILNIARNIFIEYFTEAGLDIPSWVYYKELNDYKERGVGVWQSWYKNNKDKFIVNGDTIYINSLELWGVKDKNVDKYIDLLDKESFKDYSAPMLLLNKEPFFQYIKTKNKFKIFGIFKNRFK